MPFEHESAAEGSSGAHAAERRGDDGFTNRVLALIKQYGGVTRVARACGFSEGVVRSWRDGRSDPSRARCVALARGLGVSLMWLMAGSGSMIEETDKRKRGETIHMVNAHRLSQAMQILQSTLDSTGNSLSVESRAELLSEYYAALDNPDPVTRAEGVGEIHQHLLERIRQANAKT
ncbi:MAG TPA: transcriptional regulator [Oleiagrimonas sp.]|nr:transcriptional regulator [Oleiagrimonas sp.]